MPEQFIKSLATLSRSLRFFFALLFLTLLLILTGRWRAAATGPQVQVPMFYDDHYGYPRAWTQEQEAPGVPPPAPLSALYDDNHLSQTFYAGADRLTMVEVWLAGAAGTTVDASLSGPDGLIYQGQVTIDRETGRYYRLTLPTVAAAYGRPFTLTLAAPAATVDRPVSSRAVGGDRLGAIVRLNEYSLPGNLDLRTYSQGGLPGRWWTQALGAQLLPDTFQRRLQQYKPPAFKGQTFTALLLLMVLLTLGYLVLAWPGRSRLARPAVILGSILLLLFLGWQLGSGRLRPPLLSPAVAMAPAAAPLPLAGTERPLLTEDFALTLWTAARQPEARFVTTEFYRESTRGGLPVGAIRVPAASTLAYPLIVPPAARFRTGLQVDYPGRLRFRVLLGGVELYNGERDGQGETIWIDLPLDDFAGQTTELSLVTELVAARPGEADPDGLWLQPQLVSDKSWLLAALPPAAAPLDYQVGADVALVGYQLEPDRPAPGQPVTVTLFWQALTPPAAPATVFVHVNAADGSVAAQHDGAPVLNSYPLTLWQPGTIIADEHPLVWPEGAGLTLAVGLYDPVTFVRRPVVDAVGTAGADDQAVLGVVESAE